MTDKYKRIFIAEKLYDPIKNNLNIIYIELSNILNTYMFNVKSKKLKKHFPMIYVSMNKENKDLIFENLKKYVKHKEHSFTLMKINDNKNKNIIVKEIVENIRNTLEIRHNLVQLYSPNYDILSAKYYHNLNVLTIIDFRNILCKYETKEKILIKFPNFKDKTGRCFFKKVYSINTENSHFNILRKKQDYFFCNDILICIDYKDKINIMFNKDDNKFFGNQLSKVKLNENDVIDILSKK